MTVYVDDARIPARLGRGRAALWSHLTADTPQELHEFAERLGLRREWFQDKPRGLWHYDVTATVREAALRLGAEAIRYRSTDDFRRVYRRPGRAGLQLSAQEP